MILVTTVKDLDLLLEPHRSSKKIGFTPTMGALHGGHMSLIELSNERTDITVCSIFVNPTQFNQKDDLVKYPRTLESDLALLEKYGCDIVFFPGVEDVYPPGLETKVDMDYKGIDQAMEGEFRPGHFAGVAEVVKRFLDLVRPSEIFMGQKDYQQVALIRLVVDTFDIPTEVIMCPTVRHEDGLAQSSRNLRLDPAIRKKSNVIFRTLSWAKEQVANRPIQEVVNVAMENMSIPHFRPEYFTIVDGTSLDILTDWNADSIVACTACWAGDVRLIDNMVLKG